MANEKRLIDATEAETWAGEHILDAKERYTILDFLRECSAVDAVEVVRCKDCKHWKHFDHLGYTDFAKVCGLANYMVGATGYCVYGERRCE